MVAPITLVYFCDLNGCTVSNLGTTYVAAEYFSKSAKIRMKVTAISSDTVA